MRVHREVLRGIARYCEVLRGIARYCEVLRGIARYCEVLRSCGVPEELLGFTKGADIQSLGTTIIQFLGVRVPKRQERSSELEPSALN